MKLHPRLSRAAVELVTRFETFQPLARPAAQGGWTVGYGHTRSAREAAQVSRADAEALLLYDLDKAAIAVEQALFAPVTQRQFEALTAFCFNIGADNFRRSTALARINAGMELEAADEIERWRRAELGAGAQVVDALVRRRAAEKAHFLGLPEGFSKSPSAVLRPLAVADGIDTQNPLTSATLTAANSVQARLRELVPEPSEGVAAPPAGDRRELQRAEALSSLELSAVEPDAPPFPDPDVAGTADHTRPATVLGDDVEAASLIAANDMETPLPPILLEPTPGSASDLERSAAAKTTVATEAVPPTPAPHVAAVVKTPLAWDRRTAYALLTGVGACLFVIAAVLILGGKPGLSNLALGVVGVLLVAPGVYGLLGPRKGLEPFSGQGPLVDAPEAAS